jgi:GAF domain-containing protein
MCEIAGSDMFPDHRAAGDRLGHTHYLGVPLLVGERAIGVLTFRGGRPFTAREQELAETFAGQAAIAIDHSRLHREASEEAERMRVVAELGRVLVSTLDESRVIEIVGTQAHETLGMPDMGVWLQDPDSGGLHLAAGRGPYSAPLARRAEPMEPGEGVVGRALTEGRPVWTSDVLHDPRIRLRPESRRWIEEIGGRAILAVPIIREHVLGALVAYRPPGARFEDREVEYLSAFANQVAAALENARLYQALDVRAARLRSMARLAHIVSSSLDMDEVLRAIAEAAAELVAVPLANVWVANETTRTLTLQTVSAEFGLEMPIRQVAFGETAVGWVALHRRTLAIADARRTRAYVQGVGGRHDIRSLLAIPSSSRTRCSAC